MTRYVNLDADGYIIGHGTTTDPASLEMMREHHKGNLEVVPDDLEVAHGAKYDKASKKIVEKPKPVKPPTFPTPTPEQERTMALPSLDEFAEAYYQEKRGSPAAMEAYLRKRDEVERRFPKGK